jgi:hypothetical protein
MGDVQDTLYVNVEYSTEDEEFGPVYIATCHDIGLVTDGVTLDELVENVRDVLSVILDGIDTVARFNVAQNPRIILTFQLPQNYAKTA